MTLDELVDKLVQGQQKGLGSATVFTVGTSDVNGDQFLLDIDAVEVCSKNDFSAVKNVDVGGADSDPFVVLT